MLKKLNGSALKILFILIAGVFSASSHADVTNEKVIVCRSSSFVKDIVNASLNSDDKTIEYLLTRKLCQGFKPGLQYEIVDIDPDGVLSVNFVIPTTGVEIRLYSTRKLMRVD